MRVIVAGVGNVLRGDDGFGVAVVERLLEQERPDGVLVLDIGIGGIHLVQELLDPTDVLVIIDAVELGRPPGTVAVVAPHVREASGPDDLADMHFATPDRALMLARGLDVLPSEVWLVGCQPLDAESVGQGLSPELERAVDVAAREVRRLVTELGAAWG